MFVVSTTGDGDPPDTVTKFWRRLRKKTLDSSYLKSVRFALLGRYCIQSCRVFQKFTNGQSSMRLQSKKSLQKLRNFDTILL